MSDDHPVACTLTAEELPRRVAEIGAIGRASLLGVERGDSASVLRFRSDAQTRRRLAAIVEAESRCCAFLRLDLRGEAGALLLTIAGSELAQPTIAELVSAFGGDSMP